MPAVGVSKMPAGMNVIGWELSAAVSLVLTVRIHAIGRFNFTWARRPLCSEVLVVRLFLTLTHTFGFSLDRPGYLPVDCLVHELKANFHSVTRGLPLTSILTIKSGGIHVTAGQGVLCCSLLWRMPPNLLWGTDMTLVMNQNS